ncbi:sugar ABC transporter ATP-binding protein [Escherichia coli]|uniref:Sugar ABC transporter ATP-binding protein n=1 Tax=Escherichia coli TaxID=562 RepID=A0A377KDH6_ECOLX|nr:sugar ABC transporter ATP-binding protein [Escherichia coli]
MTTDQHQEILRTEGLSKFFPGVKALDNVNFSLRRGEIMALLGENGAGKSTLIKALTGVYHADRGTIWLEGQAISPKNTAHAQQLGIGTVYQEVNLLPNMSVADNLFIGREPKRFGLLRRKEMEKRATETDGILRFLPRRARTAQPLFSRDAANRRHLPGYRSLRQSADPR